MSVLDLEKLLTELSDEAPCGEDLEYDSSFQELERSTQGKEEQQFGDTIVPAEEPDWKAVKKSAVEILGQTKDLRVGVHLARALLRLDGFPGFADALALLRGYIEKFWETVHPQLDPDDANDPTMRVNTFLTICHFDSEHGFESGTALRHILDAPIVQHRAIGSFSLHDLQIVDGTRPLPPDMDAAPESGTIDAAFMEIEIEELQATADAVKAAVEHAAAIDTQLTELVGAAQAADLAELHKILREVDAALVDRLSRRGVNAEPEAGPEGEGGEASGTGGGDSGQAMSFSGQLTTREEAVKMLDKVIDYFGRHEPSSPIPLLLHRAKRLVSKSFMEIMQDLAPDGLAQAMMMGGVKDEPPAQ